MSAATPIANMVRDISPVETVLMQDAPRGSTLLYPQSMTNLFVKRWVFVEGEPLVIVSIPEKGGIVVLGGGDRGGTREAHPKGAPVREWYE